MAKKSFIKRSVARNLATSSIIALAIFGLTSLPAQSEQYIEVSGTQIPVEEPESPAPYSGPIIGYIDYRPSGGTPDDDKPARDTKPRPGGELVMEGPNVDQIEEAEIDKKPADVTKDPDGERVIIKIPEETTPGVKDIVVKGPFGELTIQDGVTIYPPLPEETKPEEDLPPGFTLTKPADCLPVDTAFSAWTQDQGDDTVLFFAKNVVGAGEIGFQQNRRVLLEQSAVSEDDPRIRWGNCSPYFLHRFSREDVKNGLEVYQDGSRVWRAAYSGTGIR